MKKSPLLRGAAAALRCLLLAYTLALAGLYLGQTHLLYFPATMSLEDWRDQARLARARLLEEGQALLVEPPRVSSTTPTAIVFHGNGGHALHRLSLANALVTRGYRVVLAEYPGYGPNPGWPTESTLVASALRLTDDVRRRWPGQVTLVGESLGSGVAAQVVLRRPSAVARLVLITPFRSLRETAQQKLRWMPVGLLLHSPFESELALAAYQGPSSVLVANHDEVIGAAQGQALHRFLARKGPATLVILPNATHNSWLFDIRGTDWDRLLALPSGQDAPTAARFPP